MGDQGSVFIFTLLIEIRGSDMLANWDQGYLQLEFFFFLTLYLNIDTVLLNWLQKKKEKKGII